MAVTRTASEWTAAIAQAESAGDPRLARELVAQANEAYAGPVVRVRRPRVACLLATRPDEVTAWIWACAHVV